MGKPGGGKGLFAMKLIVEELLRSTRPVVTNLAVRWEPWVSGAGVANCGLRHYLQVKHKLAGDLDVIRKRITILQDEQCYEFWRFRPGGVECLKDGEKFDTATALGNGGAFYVIDECWQFFSSRFSKATEQIQFYAAQHRKFGDDVLLVTQSTKQVMPALRELGQDFTVIRNHGKERIGIFRQPSIFVADTYTEPPGPTSKAMCTTPFTLDRKGLAQCYDTSSGVGIAGQGGADVHERKKGFHWMWIIVGLFLIFLLLVSIPWWTKWGTHKYFNQFEKQMRKVDVKAAVVAVSGEKVPAASRDDSSRQVSGIMDRGAAQNRPSRRLTGICWTGNRATVYFSDGESYRSGDPQLRFVGSDFAVVEGVYYKLHFRPNETMEAKKGAEAPWTKPAFRP